MALLPLFTRLAGASAGLAGFDTGERFRMDRFRLLFRMRWISLGEELGLVSIIEVGVLFRRDFRLPVLVSDALDVIGQGAEQFVLGGTLGTVEAIHKGRHHVLVAFDDLHVGM